MKKDISIGCMVDKRDAYLWFINKILSYADEVYLLTDADSKEEFETGIWMDLKYYVSDYFYGECAFCSGAFVSFPCNYAIRSFFLKKDNIYDFEFSEEAGDINMENPAFLKDGEIFCYSLTHEFYCDLSREVYETIFNGKVNYRCSSDAVSNGFQVFS